VLMFYWLWRVRGRAFISRPTERATA